MPNLWTLIASLAFFGPPLAINAEKQYQALPKLVPPPTDEPLPSLSIIIPARNEADNLTKLLPSLKAIDYNGSVEVIVVDDNSSDQTAMVAQGYNVRVVQVAELPQGWLGKPHACHVGAQAATGDWLLFTDADTTHQPHGPATAVGYANYHLLDGLSLFIRQQTYSWWDGLALLVAFAGLFAGLNRNRILLNGQYILLRKDVYQKSEGFAAVRAEPLEDIALGYYLATLGYSVSMMRGESAAQVAMYRTWGDMWRGLTRLGAGSLRWAGAGSLMTVLFITAVMTPVLTLLMVLTRRLPARWLFLTWVAATPGLLPWASRFGVGAWALLAPIGALLVQCAATWGLLRRLFGKDIQWKNRSV